MKRSVSFRNDVPLATHPNLTASTAQRGTDVVNEGGAVENTGQEIDLHTASKDPNQPRPMLFPGPYAYAILPAAVGQAGLADAPAALDTPATTYTSSTATASSASAEAPAGRTMPEAPHNDQQGNPDGLPPLLLAARLGNLDQLRMLLAQPGTSVMQAHANGLTALHIAASEGHAAIVECLIDAGADVNAAGGKDKRTALIFASLLDKLDVVKALLKRPGILVDLADEACLTALDYAVRGGGVAIVKCLISAGADGNAIVPDTKVMELTFESKNGRLEAVKALLKHPGMLVDGGSVCGMTALHAAARNGHAAIVECLIDAGADANYLGIEINYTALLIASKKGRLDVVKAFLKHPGILVDQINHYGATALHMAAGQGHVAIVECLIDAGADVNHAEQEGNTPLMFGAAAGHLEVVQALLRVPGILVDPVDNDADTALHEASQAGHVAIVECLINAGADRARTTLSDESCLHAATNRGRANVVEYLLGLGAPLPNPLPQPSPDREHFDCLSDLYLDQRMPAASADNPLRLRDPRQLDHGNQFLVKLTSEVGTHISLYPAKQIASLLAAAGILNAVIKPLMRYLRGLQEVHKVFSPRVVSLTKQQLLVYFASTLSRLAVLAPNQQIAAPYVKAGLSDAGVARLSRLGIAQRDQLVALAEEFAAQHARNVLNQLMPLCLAKTGFDFQLDAKALKTTLIDAGLIPMLADMLATCWNGTLRALASMPVAVPQMGSVGEMMAFSRKRVEDDSPSMFAREILQQLDGPDILRQWRATLGESKAEGLFFLFDDQCRQLRQYAAQIGERGG